MRCRSIKEQLADYRHGRVSDAVGGTIREHLIQCSDCNRHYRLEQFTGALLASTREVVEPPPFFAARVRARLSGAVRDVEQRRGMFIWLEVMRQAMPAMLALILILLAFTVLPIIRENGTDKGQPITIEDVAMRNGAGEEEFVLSPEEVTDAHVSRVVLTSGK